MKQSLKDTIYEAIYKSSLTRQELKKLCAPAEPSTAERRMRELCNDFPIYPVTKKGVIVTEGNSFLIDRWVWGKPKVSTKQSY